jgi:hypothetical protein
MHRNPAIYTSAALIGATLLASITPLPAAATIALSELEGRIVFMRWGGFDNGFFIANADGSDQQRLVAVPPADLCCLWVADDGSRASIPTGSYSRRTEAVEIVNLEDLSTVVLDRLSGDLNTIGGPFSPDATQMAYNVDEPEPRPGFPVYIGPSDDPSEAVQIVATEDHGPLTALDYSPDGRQLLLYRPAPGDTGHIHGSLAIINVDGSGFRPLTPEGLDLPGGGQWSPDGASIVFADSAGGLLTIKPDGSGLTEVYSAPDRWAFQPNWSPDGSQIIFSLNTSADPNDPAPNGLYVIDDNGNGLTPLITTPDRKDGVSWVPDVRAPG